MTCYLMAAGLGAGGFLLGLLVGSLVIKRREPIHKMMTKYLPASTTELKMNGAKCTCHACIAAYRVTLGGRPLNNCRMIVCNLCGSKRCPHALDHVLECTKGE